MKITQKIKIALIRRIHIVDLPEEHLFLALILIVGVTSGMIAVGLKSSIHYLTDLFHTNDGPSLLSILGGGIFIFISGHITTHLIPFTSGSGIPQTKIAIVVRHGVIKIKEWGTKLFVTILSLSSGIPLGIEGPTVTVTSGIASSLGNLISLSKLRVKSLVAVGAAGGIAAAFNAPIAAVTFTLEEIVGNLNSTKILGPIIISSVLAAVTAQTLTNGSPIFELPNFQFNDPTELIFCLLIGIIAAILGPLWVKTVLSLRQFNNKLFRGHKLTIIMINYFIIMGIAYYLPHVLGSGHHLINEFLTGHHPTYKIVITLFAAKFILTALIYGSGISGGLFMPTLFLGAMIGVSIQVITPYLSFIDTSSYSGAFILIGMGAFFAAVIRAPFTSILIIFEMTQDYKIIPPLMVSNIAAYLLSQRSMGGSIYEKISAQDGIHLPGQEDTELLSSITVEDAMIREVHTLNSSLSVEEALKKVNHSEISGYPVLKNGDLFGVISTTEIGMAYAKFKEECPLEQVCTTHLITIYPDQSLLLAFHYLKRFKISRLLVVSRLCEKKLVGILTAEDIVKGFGYHIQEEHKSEVIDQILAPLQQNEDINQKN